MDQQDLAPVAIKNAEIDNAEIDNAEIDNAAIDNAEIEDVATKTIVGFIEIIDESGIYGWAYDRDDTSRPAILQLHIDDAFIVEFECSNYRSDVQAAGHPRADVGFHVRIPRSYYDSVEYHYQFTDQDGEPVALIRHDVAPGAAWSFRFERYFDAEFYRRFYDEARSLGDHAARLHWSAASPSQPRYANAQELIADLAVAHGPLPEDFSPYLYRLVNEDIAMQFKFDWEATAHYLELGRAQNRTYGFAKSKFLTDLYFGGVAPPVAALEAFITENEKTLYISLQDLLERNGVKSDGFLKYLNVADYIASHAGLDLKTKLQCIAHFVQTGIKVGTPLSFDHYFDQSFVAAMDDAYASLPMAEAYLRWINLGVDAGLQPNGAAFLAGLGLSETGEFPAGFDADIYIAKNPDLKPAPATRWAALQHCIQAGLPEGREGCPIGPGARDIYRAAADRLAVAGQLKSARKIYETLLLEDPDNTLGSRHYGDCLLRQGEHFLAARIYERTIEAGHDNTWTHLNLGLCYIKLQRWSDACRTLQRVSLAEPGDRALVRRHRDVLKEAYAALAADAHWLANNKFYDQARQRMAQACELLAAPLANTTGAPSQAFTTVRSVAIIADIGLPQCKAYRVDQKIEQLEAAGIKTTMIDYRADVFKFVRGAVWIDAVILYRTPATPDVMWSIWLLRRAGIPIFFEIDDLMFKPEYFPDSFESYGGQISHDLYATLITGSISLAAAMSVCDYALASTPSLASEMQGQVISKRAFVHRNALGAPHQKSYQIAPSGANRERVRIFYGSGTKAHNEDFETHLAGPLARLLGMRGGRSELFIMGYLTLPRALLPFRDKISIHPPVWDLRLYWNILREMDINLAVLKPGIVADCKSEIKWLEAAMLGVPSVVTATRTYAEVIDNGKNGILIQNESEWFEELQALVVYSARRRAIGQAARETALQSYSIQSMAANIVEIMGAVTAEPSISKKRILVVNVFYPPQAIGGATRVVADNIADLLATHHDEIEVQVFTTIEGGAEAYVPLTYVLEGVKVIAVPTPIDSDINRKMWDDRMGALFERVVERFKPDLVHFHCIQRITLSVCESLRRNGIPYVVTVHDGWWISDEQFMMDQYGNRDIYDFANPLHEFAAGDRNRFERMRAKHEYLAAAERVIAVSESFGNLYKSCGFSNVVTISNGVSPLQVLPRVPAQGGLVRLAHIGGASFHKGYNHIRAALSRGAFANLSLLVIDHAMDPGTQRKTRWGATGVTFRGKYPQSKVAELYRQVDVLLAPSVWPESYGLVTREAAMAGCWVVASDRGAIGQDVTPENGFVIDIGSSDALFDVFAEINANPEKYTAPVPPLSDVRTAGMQADELAQLYRELLPSMGAAVSPAGESFPSMTSPSARKRKSGAAKPSVGRI